MQVMQISTLIKQEFNGAKDLSAIGGVETGRDAAEFLLLGANSVQARGGLLFTAALCEWHVSMYHAALQVCTGVMLHGYPLIKKLCGGLQVSCAELFVKRWSSFQLPLTMLAMQAFMREHGFNSIEEFRGHSLPYFTTHTELVRMQREAIAAKKKRVGLENDADWTGDGFVQQSDVRLICKLLCMCLPASDCHFQLCHAVHGSQLKQSS